MASVLNKRPSKTQTRKYFSMTSIYKICNLLLQQLFLLQVFKGCRHICWRTGITNIIIIWKKFRKKGEKTMRKKNELEMRTGNEVMDGKVRRNYEGNKKKEWWDKKQKMVGNEERVKDWLSKKIRSKKKYKKKRFKEGKRDFRKPHRQDFWKSFHLLRYAATELD